MATDLQRIMIRKTITEPLSGYLDQLIGVEGKGGKAGTGLVGRRYSPWPAVMG